ncbi:MAG TPA: Ig-like domain-containing protein, partial [Gemmataceae bacterium]|nr:Ig-like domain-containing protein [Gemmataceae bacterium]
DGFRVGRALLTAPFQYSLTWTNPPIGWHTLYAIAIDNQGAATASDPVNLTVYDAAASPLVQITAPFDGTTFQAPIPGILITAQASTPGRVTNVEFYANGNLLGHSADLTTGLRADYQFRNSLGSSVAGAPLLANLGPNTFTTAAIDGMPAAVLHFAANDGLSLKPASATFSTNYTLAALFSFDTIINWRRILDFSTAYPDNGLYFINGTPTFYYYSPEGPDTITPNTFVQIVLTRDGSSSNVVCYLDGKKQFTFIDDTAGAVPGATDTLRLFRDDTSEASSGAIARFRIYDRPLRPDQIAALDRAPATISGPAIYSFFWTNAPLTTNIITAIAYSDAGSTATSAPVTLIVNPPPINTNPPVIVAVDPVPGSVLSALYSVVVTFSEPVANVDASDLLINGQPAYGLNGSGSNYIFFVEQPPFGSVTVSWATNHGIHDFGYPSDLPFDEQAPTANWTYQLVDRIPPTINFVDPPPGSVLTNLTQFTVGFSENVLGVDAADLLVNGSPAFNVIGSNARYTFEFPRPGGTTIVISWAGNHGITDAATPPNAFDATGISWIFTLDTRTILIQSNSVWRFVKGTREASTPTDAWRRNDFNDSGWSNAPAPFYYGDPYNSFENPGTLLSDMLGGYTSIYLRSSFFLSDSTAVTNLFLRYQSDDGFIMWLNGNEVLRYNVPGGELAFNATASSAISEPQNRGAPYLDYNVPNPGAFLIAGTNVIAVHAFNQSLSGSSDFGFNAQIYGYLADPSIVPPRIQDIIPTAGEVFLLTNITVRFTEPVTNVDAGDLLINGVPAVTHESTNGSVHSFTFAQPNYGPINVTWTNGHDIVDFDLPPKPFNATGPGATFQYTLLNPSAPSVIIQSPLAQSSVPNLTEITVTFSKPVTGVDASDLLINGIPAVSASGNGATYAFSFPQPAYGAVSISWSAGANIQDLESPPNAFDPTRANNSWSYTLVDQTPPRIASQIPTAGTLVTNLTQITVTFTEPVSGVNASDLLVNGIAASAVSGTDATYTFLFPQPNATIVNIAWANFHGIRDLATVPNSFDATAPGATWTYSTPDNIAPTIAVLDPPPYVTVPSLSRIGVTFSEPVTGVSSNDLLIDGISARSVSGSGAGPYTFAFLPPTNGTVNVRWAADHGITDLASTPNAFAGGNWTYTLDPNASFADKVLISEIMFNPRSGLPAHEWIELQNISSDIIDLASWRFTRGVDFTFPNVSIAPGEYLVVAADPEAFHLNYPAVTNYVGGWSGRLANSDETIELRTALDEVVNTVHYATEGDWARREGGRGASPVTSIVRNGNTATVTIFAHGYTGTD